LTIATRQSPLALWQANFVKAQLEHHHPNLTVKLLGLTTAGDRFIDKPLYDIGGKALFVKELEIAMLKKQADIAVHSLKDVPVDLPDELCLSCYLPRQNPRDCWASNSYDNLKALPKGAIVGTSSLRRQCQTMAMRPDITVKPLRGNVGTRLAKLDGGEYDGIILASAGLERLGLEERIKTQFELDDWLPAGGQGVMVIECRQDDLATQKLLAPLNDTQSAITVTAERTVNFSLGGSCHTPIGVYAHSENGQLTVNALVGSPDGKTLLRAHGTGPATEAKQLGKTVANNLKHQGAMAIINACEQQHGKA